MNLLQRKVLIVTGKGGTGKSLVAAALARVAAGEGRRVLLASLATHDPLPRLLGVSFQDGLPLEPAAVGPGLDVVRLEPESVARDFFRVTLRFDFISRRIAGSPVFRSFLLSAPGLKELLYLGKLWYACTRTSGGGRAPYDLVVLDGPATGHALALLAVPDRAVKLFGLGPMRGPTRAIREFYQDPGQAGVVLVSLPEELPVSEARDLYTAARGSGLPLALSVLNAMPADPFPRASAVAFRRVRGDAAWRRQAADVLGGEAHVDAACEAIDGMLHRRRVAKALERRLKRDVPLPTLRLPELPGAGPGPQDLGLAAEVLRDGLRGKRGHSTFSEAPVPGIGAPIGRKSRMSPFPPLDGTLDRALAEARVLVCCGSGGVGKTTLSAALGVAAARRGRKVLVATVDPARRLADALGVGSLADEERPVRGDWPEGGGLWAMMLDTQRTFDRLVRRHAPDEAAAQRILGNRIYRVAADTVAGTQEFMAMERLYELHEQGRYDLIVLDTPPTANALEFLSAPQRMADVLGSGVIALFASTGRLAGRWGLSLLRRGGEAVLAVVRRLVGAEFLAEFGEFFQAFEGMYGGFRERAELVRGLLTGPDSRFVQVTSPSAAALDEAAFLAERLEADGLPLTAVLVNRVRTLPKGDTVQNRVAASGAEKGQAPFRRRKGANPVSACNPHDPGSEPYPLLADMVQAYRRATAEAAADRDRVGALRARVSVPVLELPRLDHEIHDLRGLGLLAELVAPTTPPVRPA